MAGGIAIADHETGIEGTPARATRQPVAAASLGRPGVPVDLPYGPWMTARLGALHRAFLAVNRFLAAPLLRAGLGSLLSTPVAGSLMLLRTTGCRTGRAREAPLGYVILDGAVYCCAGFGTRTGWYHNLLADPHVEVVLPSLAFAGIAERVTQRAEWDQVYPVYHRSLGVIGRLTLGDLALADAERIETLWRTLPLVRIRPTGLASGPADPTGSRWIVVQAAWLALVALVVRSLRRR